MTHGTTDTAQLGGNPADLPTLPPIVKQPRQPVKRWTLRVVGAPHITADTALLAEVYQELETLKRKLIALTPYGRT